MQAGYWRNSESLYFEAIRVGGDNCMAYHHLGMFYSNQGKYDRADAMYKKPIAVDNRKFAIRLNPTNVTFYRNLALACTQPGKQQKAAAVMEQVKWLPGQGKPWPKAKACVNRLGVEVFCGRPPSLSAGAGRVLRERAGRLALLRLTGIQDGPPLSGQDL